MVIFGVYYAIFGFLLFINTRKSLRLNSVDLRTNKELNHTEFVILVPLLREQKVIKETFAFLLSLDYSSEKLKIIIITTERENEEKKLNKNRPSTIDIVKQAVPELNKIQNKNVFFHIHYPFGKGAKSDQLNYALHVLYKEKPQNFKKKNLYIGLYDADSKTNKNVLKVLATDAEKNNFPIIYQQPSIYLKNFNLLPNNFSGLFMKSFALWQTRYSLGYEVPMFLKSPIIARRRLGVMQYCIGHGLFIRADFLKKVGFFPTPIEDTRLGHILSYLKKEIRLLPLFEIIEVTNKIKILLKQTGVWYWGESRIIEDFKIANQIEKIDKIKAFFLIIYKSLRNFLWATEGLIFTLFIILGISMPNKIPLFIFTIGLLTYFYLSAFYLLIRQKRLRELTNNSIKFTPQKKDFLYCLIFLPLNGCLLFFGPQYGIFRFLFMRSSDLPKTER
jgi:hypothetical protein